MARGPQIKSNQIGSFDLGAMSLLTRKPATNAMDDLFDSPTIDPKWTLYGGPGINLTALPGWVKMSNSNMAAIIQPISGNGTYEAEMLLSSGTIRWGVTGMILTSGTNAASSTACVFTFGQRSSAGHSRINITKYINDAYNSNYTEVLGSTFFGDHVYYRIIRTGTSNDFWYSLNGVTFQQFATYTDAQLGFTPTHIGVASEWNFSFTNGFYYTP